MHFNKTVKISNRCNFCKRQQLGLYRQLDSCYTYVIKCQYEHCQEINVFTTDAAVIINYLVTGKVDQKHET